MSTKQTLRAAAAAKQVDPNFKTPPKAGATKKAAGPAKAAAKKPATGQADGKSAAAPKDTPTDIQPAWMTLDDPEQKRAAVNRASKTEQAALRKWEKDGRNGDRPATPALDFVLGDGGRDLAIKARKAGEKKTRTPREHAGVDGANKPAVPSVIFVVDGKPYATTDPTIRPNRLRNMAKVVGMSAKELRTLLESKKITNPEHEVWSVKVAGHELAAKKVA